MVWFLIFLKFLKGNKTSSISSEDRKSVLSYITIKVKEIRGKGMPSISLTISLPVISITSPLRREGFDLL
jgi:hypothetical protein